MFLTPDRRLDDTISRLRRRSPERLVRNSNSRRWRPMPITRPARPHGDTTWRLRHNPWRDRLFPAHSIRRGDIVLCYVPSRPLCEAILRLRHRCGSRCSERPMPIVLGHGPARLPCDAISGFRRYLFLRPDHTHNSGPIRIVRRHPPARLPCGTMQPPRRSLSLRRGLRNNSHPDCFVRQESLLLRLRSIIVRLRRCRLRRRPPFPSRQLLSHGSSVRPLAV